MIKLRYSFVGERRIGSVNCDAITTLEDVRDAIALKERLDCAASSLRLYLAQRTSGDAASAWLREGDDELLYLIHPHVPQHLERAYVQPTLGLRMARTLNKYFPNGLQGIPEEAIHLLVDARPFGDVLDATAMTTLQPTGDITSGKAVKDVPVWVPEPEAFPQLAFDDKSSLLCIPKAYLTNSGIKTPHPDGDLVLYRRPALQDQWSMIQHNSLNSYARHWIIGAPGTGKSSATYAFACGQVDRTRYDVVWFHYVPETEKIVAVKFVGDVKSTYTIPKSKLSSHMDAMLEISHPSRAMIVFYDGYNRRFGLCTRLQAIVTTWQMEDVDNRRLVVVTSMTSLEKQLSYGELIPPRHGAPHSAPPVLAVSTCPAPCPVQTTVTKFHLVSWSLDEYLKAIEQDAFFASVAHMLGEDADDVDAPPALDEEKLKQTRADLVRAKFYVVGGSARYMFTRPTITAIRDMEDAVERAKDVHKVLTGQVGNMSPNAVHTLLAYYFDRDDQRPRHRLVSTLVARLVAARVGPDKILRFAQVMCTNPSMDGHVLEAWVIASVAHSGLEFELRGPWLGAGVFGPSMNMMIPQQMVTSFDPLSDYRRVVGWCVPTLWNQGGYDAVCMETERDDKSHHFYFVQVTRSETHSFNAEPFWKLLHKIKAARVKVDVVELLFIVPQARLKAFKAPVDELAFQKDVIDVVYPAASALAPRACHVHVCGVAYEMMATRPSTAMYQIPPYLGPPGERPASKRGRTFRAPPLSEPATQRSRR